MGRAGRGHLWLGRRKGLVFLLVLPMMFALGLALHGRIFPVELSQPLVALAALAEHRHRRALLHRAMRSDTGPAT